MKSYSLVLAAALGCVALPSAQAVNITIPDSVTGGNFGGGPYGAGGEDNEVEKGAVTGQHWDLEGFDLNGTQLSLWGGFDFINGEGQGNDHWGSGDIFIDVDNNANWGKGLARSSSNADFKYDYVISFDRSGDQLNLTYDVFKIGDDTKVLQTHNWSGDKFDWSNPFALDRSQGTFEEVLGWQDIAFTYHGFDTAGNPLGFQGYNGNNLHNELIVSLGFLTGDELNGALIHFTMECGNDGMKGRVPDGGTSLVLLGTAVGMLGWLRRRQR